MHTSISQRIEALRLWLTRNNYDAIIVPHEDEYLSEYLPLHNERLHWATGFTGSAGVAVITQNNAAIFVDGRYTVQVQNQVPDSIFEYKHLIDDPYLSWINSQFTRTAIIAFDPKMHSANWYNSASSFLNKHMSLAAVAQNPIDQLWADRPIAKLSEMRLMDDSISGQSCQDKRDQISAYLTSNDVDAAILTKLDSICWLLNIRGSDISRLPVLLSHAIIYSDATVDFFLDSNRKIDGFEAHAGTGVSIKQPDQLQQCIDKLAHKRVILDPMSSNAWFKLAMDSASIEVIESPDPCSLPKAQKNNVETDGMKSCHVLDGIAMVKFLRWLDEEVAAERLHNEAIISDKLQAFREQEPSLVDLSFDTISAAGANAAMCHYNHNDQSAPGALSIDSLYLVDSGGQYLNGTTDITRTVAIGTPSLEMRTLFTLVLKGHISLANAVFPHGTTGSQLDVLARQHLWSNGYDYDHGTGHGVGHFLSVHEGPQSISKKPNTVALLPGMVLSNEPGYYRADHFGIRIENLELVVEKKTNGDFSALGFESLTLCPIDYRNIEVTLLTDSELNWLNQYHQKVWHALHIHLEQDDKGWLRQATMPLSR
ncbi:aminopeptidase P family protein [Vibrio sp. TH_r3]|uniref:aminopeptidase P family protein n=1 Tax=Vibrio sp. TH_r3 TaxID=3082084 RepID=UPI0029552449|nr:aminopeptidase P family protein [Vibrio sp. TH_r3]MDV7106222.1 aminopeptidase P family protein [Vibrio sp. TH_r3]